MLWLKLYKISALLSWSHVEERHLDSTTLGLFRHTQFVHFLQPWLHLCKILILELSSKNMICSYMPWPQLCKISALCHDPMERKSISTAPHLHTIFCKAFFRHHGDKSSVDLYVTLFLSAFKVDGLLFKGGSFMCRKGCHDWICQVENTWTRWVLQFERSHFETGGFFKCVIEKVLLEPKIELIQAMEEDLKNGLYPFFVSTTLGTTGCVAFDNLEEIGI